jgi:hypothetical protein
MKDSNLERLYYRLYKTSYIPKRAAERSLIINIDIKDCDLHYVIIREKGLNIILLSYINKDTSVKCKLKKFKYYCKHFGRENVISACQTTLDEFLLGVL